MFFRSERLFLRPCWPEDWQDLFSAINDEGVVRNLARAPWPYGTEDAQAFAGREWNGQEPSFLVTLPGAQGTRLIGGAGIHLEDGNATLGYWIARAYWGQGYATEAARALVSLGRALGHDRLVADHFVDNPASGRVLRKAGFCPTGRCVMRHSLGRGGEAPTLSYEIELGVASGDDGDGMKRAA